MFLDVMLAERVQLVNSYSGCGVGGVYATVGLTDVAFGESSGCYAADKMERSLLHYTLPPNQLETYRAMNKGNRAADIDLTRGGVARGTLVGQPPQRLSDLASGRVLVVFAAGWCPKCRTEVPEMAQLYPKWKVAGMDVLLISLDDDPESFAEFTSGLPFLSYCDLRKWDSYPAKDYHVFGTPTMFLLDDRQTILLRPTSVNQVDAWVDWFLLEKR